MRTMEEDEEGMGRRSVLSNDSFHPPFSILFINVDTMFDHAFIIIISCFISFPFHSFGFFFIVSFLNDVDDEHNLQSI